MEQRKKLVGVLVSVSNPTTGKKRENATATRIEFEDSLDDFYRLIGCNCVDIVTRKVYDAKKPFAIILDDNGLLYGDAITSAVTFHERQNRFVERLVGNLLIVKDGEEGELASLDESEVKAILASHKRRGILTLAI